MIRWTTIVVVFFGVGCVHNKVVRDRSTYTVEIFASLARQLEAAEALFGAAEAANAEGDDEACAQYAAPALMIEAKARSQAFRSLWLAGLPYPKADGTMPVEGEVQDDPGPSSRRRPVAVICGGVEER